MTSYAGRHAEIYDLIYSDKPYGEEARFVKSLIDTHSLGGVRRVLELACGTGSHALALEDLGFEVVATDYSEDMLEQARLKAESSGSSVQFIHQDMRLLDVDTRPFDAVVCLFDSIGYVETNGALAETLSRVHGHLRPGGVFVFEFWHAAAMLRGYEPVRVRRWTAPWGQLCRVSETVMRVEQQACDVTYTIIELRSDGSWATFAETQTNRFFLIQEMAAWLERAQLIPVQWFAGYSEDKEIDLDTWHVVGLARRP